MFKYCVTLFVAALAATAVNAQFMINTPVAVQCEPTMITWAGGKAPYFLTVVPGGNPTAPAIVDLGQQSGTSFTWNTNVAAGTSLSLNLRDSSGTVAQSGIFTVQASSDTSCLNGTASGTSGGTATTAATSGGSTPTSPATTTGGSSPTTRATTGGANTGTGASTSPRPTNSSSNTSAGSRTLVQWGTVGAAAFVAALMA